MDKKSVLQMLQADFARFHQEQLDISKTIQNFEQDVSNYMDFLMTQISTNGSGPLLAKTPRVSKKKAARIKAIPEDSEMEMENSLSSSETSTRPSRVNTVVLETSEVLPSRSKRGASIKAADIIKKQQSLNLHAKLRRPSSDDIDALSNKVVTESKLKRPKESTASSEEENTRPSKQIKLKKNKTQSKSQSKNAMTDQTHIINNQTHTINDQTHVILNDSTMGEDNESLHSVKQTRASVKRKLEMRNDDENTTLTSEHSMRQTDDEPVAKKPNVTKLQQNEKESKLFNTLDRISEKSTVSQDNKKIQEPEQQRITRSSSLINAHSKKYKMNNVINETVDMDNPDETVASMYEDAIGKPIPIMNSTMNPNSTVTLEKMMNVTVLIEPLKKQVMNETIIIKKNSFKEPLSRNNSTLKEVQEPSSAKRKSSKSSSNGGKKAVKNQINLESKKDEKIDKFNELITDDESSPERKEYRKKKEKLIANQPKRVTRSNNLSLTSDDEIHRTPEKVTHANKEFKGSAIKSSYKQAILFSPYAKDSVKKRVEAFEQVAISPKQDEPTAGRVTRTKTRALAAATVAEAPTMTVTQKLARKSLAKAKKISLAKHAKEVDDTKENENTANVRATRIPSSVERSAQKSQQKTTPLGKNRMLQLPSSVNKTQYATPSNNPSLNAYSKPLTASRGNIVTHVDSFIQPMKSTSASKHIDRVAEEKRRRAHDEDARRKREELLKSQAEERRRKREEKELKNKLAREAKEKQEYERRLKAEREKEEKAKLAQQLQEKQKEEIERKRMAQLQRAQEKEERRKQEEYLRLQRLQEQEEQERQLAEQKRREQEMEKRKLAEQRQQMAELKTKIQMDKALMQAKAKYAVQKPVQNYKIDSDPDEEESDDESRPKHQIPSWASKPVRQAQLVMQQYIPMKLILRYFDAQKCSPDLRELFHGIDPKKLKRSSSAIWKTPPRFSMMNQSIIQS